jgi:DNA-directed RNA polymerase specialized sigma24 family protein
MIPDLSITHWLELLKSGDRAAVLPLWDRYFHPLVARARLALRGIPCRVLDEEDIALSAFDSFCRGAEQGRFPHLDDRDDLWRLLLTITARKISHQVRAERRLRRGGGQVWAEADLGRAAARGEGALAGVACRAPTPDLAVQMAEESRLLLDRLGDEQLRSIALWQMEGYTIDEIATRIGRTTRTVSRKLQVIRDRWERRESDP